MLLGWMRSGTKAIALGDRARDAGQWVAAARHYSAALRRKPDNPPIWVQYGHSLKEQGKLADAESAYRKAIAGDPGNADTHLQLGHVLKLQGRLAEARTAYLQAFVIDPSLSHASIELNGFGWPEERLSQLENWLHSGTPGGQEILDPVPNGHDPGAAAEDDSAAAGVEPRLSQGVAGVNGSALPHPNGEIAVDGVLATKLSARSFVSDSAWTLRDGVIHGRIWGSRDREIRLDLHSDGVRFTDFLGRSESGEFMFRVPRTLADDEPHRLDITLAGSGERLIGPNFPRSLVYRSALPLAVDGLQRGALSGWAYDVRTPAEPLELEVLDGDTVVARGTTTEERADVNRMFGITGAHGFSLYLPASLFDGRRHHLKLRCRGEVITLAADRGVPRTLDPELLKDAGGRYVGRVEHASCRAVAGWALDQMNPNTPVILSVHVDGEVVGTVRATRFHSRLRHLGHGFHEFLYRLPPGLMNGKSRRVAVRVAGTDIGLPMAGDTGRTHIDVKFPLADLDAVRPAGWAPRRYRFREPRQRAAGLMAGGGALAAPAAARDSGSPAVSVIVLNLNGAHLLDDFLSSWQCFQPGFGYEILIVDHGSTDDSIEIIERYQDRLPIRLFARNANYSFSSSNNYAAERAQGKYLLFANNDLILTQDVITPLAAHLASNPDVGIVGVKLFEPVPDGRDRWIYVPHHVGIQFVPVAGQAAFGMGEIHFPEEIFDETGEYLPAVYDMPAVTAALYMCRKEDFAAVGGFHEKYFYSMEDVDLCLTFREQLGRRIVCDNHVSAIHHRSATREDRGTTEHKSASPPGWRDILAGNRREFCRRHSRRLKRTILRSLIDGESYWRRAPLRVTFVVTEASIGTAAGDLFTAMELGEALHAEFGWEVMFAANDEPDISGSDVLLVMRHDYDLKKVQNANAGLVTIAWIRNRVDEWLEADNFPAYNLIFCSSEKARRQLLEAAGRPSVLLPIATNPHRFTPDARNAQFAADLVFTGNLWPDSTREAVDLLDSENLACDFAIYGQGWGNSAQLGRYWRGALPYCDLPAVYASAKLVLDDSHPVTRDWDSLNSRVFDALAAGSLVMTNCRGGARALFGELLPSFATAEELRALVDFYLRHPDERESRAATLSRLVRENHSYAARARGFRAGLESFVATSLRFGIKIGVPDAAERENWGDWHFALGIKRALEARGHFARIDLLPDWNLPVAAGDDVSLVLRGLSEYAPTPAKLNIAWLISHPEEVAAAELRQYDHVFVASEHYCRQLEPALGPLVSPLLQCTDPALFFPDIDPALAVPETIFVGNSRNQRRAVVDHALAAGIDFAVFGDGWGGRLPKAAWRERYIPNERLRHYYSGAAVVLNDHWPDMARHGFISNRIFDAAACGATIVSDDAAGLAALFSDAVIVYDGAAGLAAKVRAAIADPQERAARGRHLAQLIAQRHTFAHRVDAILATVSRLLDPQPARRNAETVTEGAAATP